MPMLQLVDQRRSFDFSAFLYFVGEELASSLDKKTSRRSLRTLKWIVDFEYCISAPRLPIDCVIVCLAVLHQLLFCHFRLKGQSVLIGPPNFIDWYMYLAKVH